MDTFNNKPVNPYQHLDFPSFDQSTTNNQEEGGLGLIELSVNLRNQLNSLKSIKKNFSKRFDNVLMSSEKKDPTKEGDNYEQKYIELKAKYEDLEETYQNLIDETKQALKESRDGHEKEIKGLRDDLAQKINYIDIMRQTQVQTQEKVNLMETRIASLETLNNTLTTQLKDKAKDLSGSIDSVNNGMTSRSRDVVAMKSEFSRLVERVANLEDIIKNLREGKKQDMKTLDEMKEKNDELKTENFQLLVENKKLKNEIEESNVRFSSLDKCLLDRRQKTDDFIHTLSTYEKSFQIINQVNLDLETIFEPLKEQNRRLLTEKEKLAEENRNMKIKLSKLEESNGKMEEESKGEKDAALNNEQTQNQDDNTKEAKARGIDIKFYVEVMEKLKEFEKQIVSKDKENQYLQSELDELKSRNLELETKIISMNRSPSRKNDQYLTVEVDSHVATSPRRTNIRNSPRNSEANRGDTENEGKENQEAMEEEEKDQRLKITRKPPKQIKKPSMVNMLTGIIICPNCSMIVKKSDKNMKDCTKCHGCIHEKCAGDQKKDVLCNPCQEKAKKANLYQHEEEDDEEKSKN